MEKTKLIPWIHEEGKFVVPNFKMIWNKEFYRNTIENNDRIIHLLNTSWIISEYPKDIVVDAVVLSSGDPRMAITKIKKISYEGIYVVPELFDRWNLVEKYIPNNLYAGPVYTISRNTVGVETFKLLNIYLAYKDDKNDICYI